MAAKPAVEDPSSAAAAGYTPRPIIQRKVALPPLSDHVIPRPRLERLLAALIDSRRVVILAASAGAGKTTAIVRAAALVPAPVAWLTVERTDAAAGRLLVYLEASLAMRLPHVQGVATEALAAGVPHAEAAGLLAEAVGDQPVVLVLDDLERLNMSHEAWSVIEAMIRFAPPTLRIVLASRRQIPTRVCELPAADTLAVLSEQDLAFTEEEAGDALAALGEPELDPSRVVRDTGGWVTGVLFEAWRSSDHISGVGGEADALHGYLASHIVGQLSSDDQDFLVTTALLPEVSVESAAALGAADAARRLAGLRTIHLPVAWSADGRSMRCHPRFREFLLERLLRRDEDEVRALRLAYGRLLINAGYCEEAVSELLAARAIPEAAAAAGQAILAVLERLDFVLAERWLAELDGADRSQVPSLTVGELMLAVGRGDYARAAASADRLAVGAREALAAQSPLAAALMASSYLGVERLDDVYSILSRAAPGPEVDAVRYALDLLYGSGEDGPPVTPERTAGPLDALVIACSFRFGRLTGLGAAHGSSWVQSVSLPRRIAALRATGRVQEALEAFDEAETSGTGTEELYRIIGPELLIDAGHGERAHELLASGRARPWTATGPVQRLMPRVIEAKLRVRLEHDAAGARAILDELEAGNARRFRLVAELIDTWYGFALLLEGDDEAARARLLRAVEGMVAGDRILELPTAAVYLAEAHWRGGHEDAADRAADLALEAAGRQGSNHTLLKALADFPAAISRRLDAVREVDSPWHALGRALLAQQVPVEAGAVREAVRLEDLGRPALWVGDDERRPRIAKSYELLAYLLTHAAGAWATRDEMLDALFAGRSDESARAYLRQAIHQLRLVLPQGVLEAGEGRVRLRGDARVASSAARFEATLAEAARRQGAERLAATREALALYDRGEYLDGVHSPWTDERRRALAELACDARYEAGELAFAAARYEESAADADAVLRSDPMREAAWRLKMRISGALGDHDGVIGEFQACQRELARIGSGPSASTRELLERLRR